MFIAKIAHRTLLVGILLCAAAGSASVSFRAPLSYPVGTNPRTAAVGDFNADGKPDIAVVDVGDSTRNDPGGVSILLGNGDGTFKPAINFTAGNNPRLVAAGDFDNDGKDDLAVLRPGVVGGSDKGDVTIFLSNGDGSFRKGQQISTFNNPAVVVAADFNLDSAIDLAVADESTITILLGRSDGSFSAAGTYLPATDKLGENSPGQLFVLDYDHDGKEDLGFQVGFPLNNRPHTLEVLLGNGDGTFQSASISNTFSVTEQPVFTGDFNHDGNVDVIIDACPLQGGTCAESFLLSNGNGMFSSPPGTNVLTPGVGTVGDFDGDGNLDLAGPTSNGQPAVVIFTGNGDGSFQQPVTLSANSNSSIEVALAADLNNDKAPDLVFIGLNSNADTTSISVMLNSATDFSLSASPLTPSSIGAGQSASSTLSLQLLNRFNNPVALSCSVQPAQQGTPTCSLNANSVSFDSSGKASATLTISAGALARIHTRPMEVAVVLWLPLVGFTFLASKARSHTIRKHIVVLLFGCTTLLGLISLSGCGGGSESRSGAVTYKVTVSATSGQTEHVTSVNVTVQ
jgi:hypothetical protein